MIKRVTVVHPRSGTDRAEVLRYWKDVHGPLIAKVPGVKRYVQNHCIESAQGHAEPPFLGIGEVWFESREEAGGAACALPIDACHEAVIDRANMLGVPPC